MNIINAIINLHNNPITKLKQYKVGNNRANNAGDDLEDYIKDLFAGVHQDCPIQARTKLIGEAFSYCGNQNNPPDAILKNGDAIEIKKIESANSALALNSSYPKQKLYSDNPMLSKACKECECWSEKDIIYAVGVIDKSTQDLSSLAFVYGTEYCASKEVYERIISDPINTARIDLSINKWRLENPFTIFDYIYKINKSNSFNFMAIISYEKLKEFDNFSELEKLNNSICNLHLSDIQIKNPNNPTNFKKAKLITFSTEAA